MITITLFVLLTLLTLISYINLNLRKRSDNLKKHGIPYLGGGLTNIFKLITGSTTIFQMEQEIYKAAIKLNTPVVGVSDFAGQVNLFVTDLDLVKAICVKDIEHFVNRRQFQSKNNKNCLSKMLFFMEGEQWKGIRAKLSPAFTTRRMRGMFQIFVKSSKKMDSFLKNVIKYPTNKSMDIDFFEISSKYALDVIASLAFGIDSKSFDVKINEKSKFEQMAQKFGIKFSVKLILKMILLFGAPKLAEFLGIDPMDEESQKYFSGVIKDVMKRRRETGERREDFLQLMMDAQKGLLKTDEESNLVMNGVTDGESSMFKGESEKKVGFDDEDIVANGLMFLMAGFDGIQSSIMFTLYCLALEPEVQEKLYEEVTSVLEKNGGKFTYEAVMDMPYLDMVMSESQRRYTAASRLERVCNKDYPISGTNIVIEKGSVISIPILGFQHDERYFPEPEKFIPERFLQENKAARHPYAYMPFGHGPRNCIGMRFAIVKVKAAVIQLVQNFRFAPCSQTKIPMEFDRSATLKPKGGMWLSLTVRED